MSADEVPEPLRRAVGRLEAVQAFLDVAIEPLGLNDLLEALLKRLKAVLGADTVTILLREGERLVARASTGLQAELTAGEEVPIGRGIAGRVAADRTPRVIDDVRMETDVWSPLLRERVRSMVAVPLVYGEAVIGVLQAGTEAERDLRDDVVLLELVAGRAASAIARARMEEERASQAVRTRLLVDFAHQLSENIDDHQRALSLEAEQIATVLGDACIFYLVSDDRTALEPVALHHREPDKLELLQRINGERLPLAGSTIGEVVRTGKTLSRFDITLEEFEAMLSPEQRAIVDQRMAVVSMISAPLQARDEVLGVVGIGRTDSTKPRYTAADRAFLEEVAVLTAVAIDNARLYRRAHESDQRLRALFNSSRIGFVARDKAGHAVEANKAYAEMMGFEDVDDLVGTGIEAIVPPQHVDRTRETFSHVFSGALEQEETDHDFERRDGSVLHGRVSTSLVRDVDRKPLYTLSIVEDVSERRRLEEQLRESQKMDALGRFAGAIAHDFNNVLTAIIGFNDWIAGELEPAHPVQAEVGEIRRAADRAADLTRQLLTFSRRQVIKPEILSLSVVVEGLAPMLGRLLGEDIQLALDLTATMAAVRADRHQLEQVIVNLAVNARDAMPHGGRLAIETTTDDVDREFARGRLSLDPGHYVVLAVSDTGHGMDTETQQHIFEPFFTTKPPGEGTGLGLSTVFGIIRQSGGTISVYSEPDHGTTFRIYLPWTDEPLVHRDDRAPQRPAADAGRGGTVLVVDDEESLRHVVRRLLERAGYTVLTAANGDEALDLVETHPGPVDLLITDIVLPGLPGPEIARRITQVRGDIKVLYSSGYPGDEITRRGLDPNAAFLAKPYALDSLVQAVTEMLTPEA